MAEVTTSLIGIAIYVRSFTYYYDGSESGLPLRSSETGTESVSYLSYSDNDVVPDRAIPSPLYYHERSMEALYDAQNDYVRLPVRAPDLNPSPCPKPRYKERLDGERPRVFGASNGRYYPV